LFASVGFFLIYYAAKPFNPQIKKGAAADGSLQRSRLDDVNPMVEFEADEVQEGAHLLALAAYILQSAVPLSLLLSQL
jgi:hypothetical protein